MIAFLTLLVGAGLALAACAVVKRRFWLGHALFAVGCSICIGSGYLV